MKKLVNEPVSQGRRDSKERHSEEICLFMKWHVNVLHSK